VVAEWWRGRTKVRDMLLASSHVVASLAAMKAARLALTRSKHIDASLTIDAIVMATAALDKGIVVTSDPADFERLAPAFPGVTVLAV
jgi:3-oxoacyl-[acyl-carrier-protein] synthase III